MNAILRYASQDNAPRTTSPDADVPIFAVIRMEGFEAAFAVAVMLGALALLLSGYV